MKKCRNCGVMIEDGLEECPLCGEPVTEERRQRQKTDEERQNVLRAGARIETEREETRRSAKIWLFQMVSLVAFTAAIIIFAADIASDFSLSWSVYPLLVIGFVYLFTAALIGFARFRGVLLVVETILVVGFLLLLGLLIGETQWFVSLGLPITVLAAVLIGACAVTIVRLKLNVLQSIAVVVLASGFFVVGLEFVLNVVLEDEIVVSWSLIAFACTLSVFFLTLFINKQLRERHAEFKKIFHI